MLLIACGALGREIVSLIKLNRWAGVDVQCLPAIWHNTPDRIPEGVRAQIRAARGRYRRIFVLYGDCGTGGRLDKVLAEEGVERIDGPHCYAFYSGDALWSAHQEDDVTSFFLTDYLARHFETLVWKGFRLDRHPELRDLMFANYRKIVYLAQTRDERLEALARQAAERLGLAYEYRFTGYGDLAAAMADQVVPAASVTEPS